MTHNEKLNKCLAAIKNGDETKFYDLVQLTYGPLIEVAKSYLIDKSCAESVMSDFYLKIYLYADRYDTSKDALSYLWQIVKNIAFSYNKKQKKDKWIVLDAIPISDNIDHYERTDARIDIEKALKRVGHIDRLIVMWTFKDGLTQDEIGQRLGMSKSAVSQRLSKTKEKLSKYLK